MSVIINGTAGVTFPDSVLQTSGVPGPGTSGNVLTSTGTIWASQAISTKPFVTGTAMLFKQTAAPTGWTKVTTDDNKALRVVSGTAGTGGSVAFTTAFASQTPTISNTFSINTSGLSAGATTLSESQMPSHNHFTTIGSGGAGCTPPGLRDDSSGGSTNKTSSSTGGGGSHTHSISGSATLSGSATSSAINLAVQYVDVIIATID